MNASVSKILRHCVPQDDMGRRGLVFDVLVFIGAFVLYNGVRFAGIKVNHARPVH